MYRPSDKQPDAKRRTGKEKAYNSPQGGLRAPRKANGCAVLKGGLNKWSPEGVLGKRAPLSVCTPLGISAFFPDRRIYISIGCFLSTRIQDLERITWAASIPHTPEQGPGTSPSPGCCSDHRSMVVIGSQDPLHHSDLSAVPILHPLSI